jgi:hypothetical protein
MVIVSRPAHTRRTEAPSAYLARWGAAAACLGGISYAAAGYLDAPDASGFVIGVVVPVLGVATPALFLGSLIGLYFLPGEGGGRLRRAALLVGLVGTVLGLFDELAWWEADRWIPVNAALTAMGLGILVGLYFLPGEGGGRLRRDALPVGLVGTVGPVRRIGLVGTGLVDAAIRLLDGGRPRYGFRGGAAVPGCPGARFGHSRVGFLAHRPRLLQRPGAHAPGPRRVCGPGLPKLHSVGSSAFS